MIDLTKIKRIIDIEHHDILADAGTDIYHDKIRAYILDGSVVDIWFSKKILAVFPTIGKDDTSMVDYIAMITFQILAGKMYLHFLSIFIMVLKVWCRRVQLMMTLFQG